MFKKFLLVVYACLILVCATQGQQLYHSVGLGTFFQQATLYRPIIAQGEVRFNHLHAMYFPRFNFQVNEPSSISIGAPLSFGAGFVNNDIFELKKTFFSYDIGIALDYNIGYHAHPPTDDKFGFYLGLGFSYAGSALDTLADSKNKQSSAGMVFRGGIRVGFPDSEKNRGITIGTFYKTGGGFEKYKTVGINVLFDF